MTSWPPLRGAWRLKRPVRVHLRSAAQNLSSTTLVGFSPCLCQRTTSAGRRRDFVATAEGRLATQASSTCTLTIGRAKSKLKNARGLHTVRMSTDHFCRATVCKDGALIAHRKNSTDVTPIKPLRTTLTATSQASRRVPSACRCALRSLAAI